MIKMVDIRAKLSSGLEQITGTLIGTKVTMDTTKVMEDSSTGDALVQTGETVGDKNAGHVSVVGSGGGSANPVCIDSITESDLTTNVYTVTGDPAIGIEGLRNNGTDELTVTINDSAGTKTKTLKVNDVYDQRFTGFTTLTFSAGAVFEADIMR